MMRNIYLDDAMRRGRMEGLQEGIIRGRNEGLREVIIRGYKNSFPITMIATSVGKTQDEVKEIIRSELGPDACQE